MRTTGIVRRIDDLGRVVIPKEIRRALGIRDGEPLEIYTEGKDTVCFRKYETNLCGAVDHLKEQIEDCCDDLTYDSLTRIEKLLEEVREIIKGEE